MPGVQSPTVRRRRFGQELRQLRDTVGLTIEEVAQRLEVPQGKISRIEEGRVSVRPRDVSDLLDQYEIQGTHRDNLLKLTRDARQQVAEAIHLYEVQLDPGLLQTSEYAGADPRPHYRSELPKKIERRVELRMARQHLVIEQTSTPIWAVLDEAVLRRHMGPPELMQSQYRRPLEFSEEKNIAIEVLSLAAVVYSVVIEYRGGIFHPRTIGGRDRARSSVYRIRATAKRPEECSSTYQSNRPF